MKDQYDNTAVLYKVNNYVHPNILIYNMVICYAILNKALKLVINYLVPTKCVKITHWSTLIIKNKPELYPCRKLPHKHYVNIASNSLKKIPIVFIVNKFILILLMMAKSGSCAKSVQGGYILNVLISIRNKILMLSLNASSAKKYPTKIYPEEMYQEH